MATIPSSSAYGHTVIGGPCRLDAELAQVALELRIRGRDDLAHPLEGLAFPDQQNGLGGHLLDLNVATDVDGFGHQFLLSFDQSLQGGQDLLGRGGQLRHLGSVPEEP